MFDRIAARYDLLNRLMTGGLDRFWRRRTVAAAGVSAGDRVLDLACGTGDLSQLCAERGAEVVGLDFAREMLRGAQRRGIRAGWIQGDGATLPLRDGTIDVVTCGFALRNFVSLEKTLREASRVLADGGRLAVLEVDRPRQPLLAMLHGFYFDRVVPKIGAWVSDREAYAYLPQSTVYLPSESSLRDLLKSLGFVSASREGRLFGAVQVWIAVRDRRAAP